MKGIGTEKKTSGVGLSSVSWFFCLFFVLFLTIYSVAAEKKRKTLEELQVRQTKMVAMRDMALAMRSALLLQVGSQSDPEWVQLVLKRKLGLIPAGQEKIYFERIE